MATFAACFALAKPYLDGFEHDGTLNAVAMTIRGAVQSRHNLVSGRSKDPVYEGQPTTRCSSSFEIIDNFGFVLFGIQLKVKKC